MLSNAKRRAKKSCVPFNLKLDDIVVPAVCPVLGIWLEVGGGISFAARMNSPSLDRIVPERGYVEGNIIVVSNLANCIKSVATPDQIIRVGEFYKKKMMEAA